MTLAAPQIQYPTGAREKLSRTYRSKLVVNPDLDRTLVSFQANRTLPFYRWLKYKEGFSAEFVRYIIEHLADRPGVLLDPFAGTGTALFAASEMGWDTIGIELLPIGFFGIEARLAANRLDRKKPARKIKRSKTVPPVRFRMRV